MSKILDWIKKHIWQTLLIVLGLFFLPLLLVHIAYRIPAVSPWFASTWEAGELITYIAGFEAFIGTVILGVVAARQNDKANELNELMLKNKEKQDAFERQPVFRTSDYSAKLLSGDGIFNEVSTGQLSTYFDVGNYGKIFVERSGQFIMLSFRLECSAKSPMKFQLNEVLILDENNQVLSNHKKLILFSTSIVVNVSFIPNDKKQLNILLPFDALVGQVQCTINIKTSFTNNIDEQFDFSTTLFLMNFFEDQWKLFFVDMRKL